MAINKFQAIFDPTTSETDNIGAYIRASDGTLLTHTDVGGKKALDVNIAAGVNVEVDLSHVDDSVKVGDGTDFLEVNVDGSINAVVSATDLDIRNLVFATDKVDVSGSSVTVSATDLDIRDLSHVSDSVKIGDGTDFLAVNGDGSINAVVSATDLDIRNLVFATDKVDVSGSSVTVSATDLDIRDLTHVSDSVKIGDGTDFLAINADGSINVNSAAITTFLSSQKTATTTASLLLASELANRKKLLLQNLGSKDVYLGGASVTTSNGIKLPSGASVEFEYGPAISLYVITPSGTADLRVQEAA